MTFGTPPNAGNGNVIPFPGTFRKRPNPRGEVFIFPCEMDGGSWGVEHVSASGDSVGFLGSFLGWNEAVSRARAYAVLTGADFDAGLSI